MDARGIAAAVDLLTALESHSSTSSVEQRIQVFSESRAGVLWTDNYFVTQVSARPGDYGYIERDARGERFVCLGHFGDLLVPEYGPTSDIYHHIETWDTVSPREYAPSWPEGPFR